MSRTDHPDGLAGRRASGSETDDHGRVVGRGTDPRPVGGRKTRAEDGRNAYEVTYAFHGHLRGACGEALSRASEELSSLRSEGMDVAFRGATLRVDAEGRVITASVRFVASDEGAIARLNCRAALPVSGIRRTEP
ncbi:hypothetical protein ACFQE8_01880 [Salinirubellus sp. GCM10025818]|uniref:hypothetical protein n=2 Tax=Salinirubellus TaxID=2162630 RepID=UPI0036093DCA